MQFSKTHILSILKWAVILFVVLFIINKCEKNDNVVEQEVTATAYITQKNTNNTGAWGDKLKSGMKSIAVSRDLIPKGLDYNTEVEIEGLPGKYLVLDKMHRRWENKIDIYMGQNHKAAKKWGKKKVVISWEIEENEL